MRLSLASGVRNAEWAERVTFSRAEFMSFMATEFTRLDKNHDGALDPNELSQASIRGFSGSTIGNKKPGGSTGTR